MNHDGRYHGDPANSPEEEQLYVRFDHAFWGVRGGRVEARKAYQAHRGIEGWYVISHGTLLFFNEPIKVGLAEWCDKPEEPKCPLLPPVKLTVEPETLLTIKVQKHEDGFIRLDVKPRSMAADRGDQARVILLLESLVNDAKQQFLIEE